MLHSTLLRRAAVTVGAASALLLSAAPVANAGVTPMTIDPTSGPAGTVIHASSPGSCGSGDTVTLELVPGFDGSYAAGGASAIVSQDHVNDAEDGSWAYDITVPGDAAAGDYTVRAHCSFALVVNQRALRAQQAGFNYPAQKFTVTQVTTTTAAPTTSVAPTSTVAATSTTTPAPPARAVPGRPTYTG